MIPAKHSSTAPKCTNCRSCSRTKASSLMHGIPKLISKAIYSSTKVQFCFHAKTLTPFNNVSLSWYRWTNTSAQQSQNNSKAWTKEGWGALKHVLHVQSFREKSCSTLEHYAAYTVWRSHKSAKHRSIAQRGMAFPCDFYLSSREFRKMKAKCRAWYHHIVFWSFQQYPESINQFVLLSNSLLFLK